MENQQSSALLLIVSAPGVDSFYKNIAQKAILNQRITEEEALTLYESSDLGLLGAIANYIREKKHGSKTFFNRNIHIEPTNVCINNCKFCSYRRRAGDEGAWEHTIEQIIEKVESVKNKQLTEIHIVGGVHPDRDLHFYGEMLQKTKQVIPEIHIKAFTAVELDFMIKKSGYSLEVGLQKLKAYGLDSIPGGGAEIFSPEIRKNICDEKATANQWLRIHETAHRLGIPSNATMLYGHLEKYHHRVDHLSKLRELQDKTHGFNSFIPLKYKHENNELSYLPEVSVIEDLKNYAVSRIFLDNFEHIKAYWVMIGREIAQTSLAFGVDDLDGTIDDSTKIYSMAGASDKSPNMTTDDLANLIKDAKRIPIERDTLYNVIKQY